MEIQDIITELNELLSDLYMSVTAKHVKAIADAIAALKGDEPRVLTFEEISALPDGAVVWEEFYNGETGGVDPHMIPLMKFEEQLTNGNDWTFVIDDMCEPAEDGCQWRWWSAEPTEAQRKRVKW